MIHFIQRIPDRVHHLAGFLFTAMLLATALWFQFQDGLEPCPLCISQRIAMLGTGLVMLAGVLHNPEKTGMRIYAGLALAIALAGACISLRHVWLQHLPPDEVPACGPGIGYMFDNFPMADIIKAMLNGTGDCAKVDWTLLGFSMPAWVLLCFLVIALWNGLLFAPKTRRT